MCQDDDDFLEDSLVESFLFLCFSDLCLQHLIFQFPQVIVFCTTAMVTRLVADLLGELNLNVREIHSRKSQSYRTKVSDEFRKSKGLILVTSDVSARGVDYPDVTLVVQVRTELPFTWLSLFHFRRKHLELAFSLEEHSPEFLSIRFLATFLCIWQNWLLKSSMSLSLSFLFIIQACHYCQYSNRAQAVLNFNPSFLSQLQLGLPAHREQYIHRLGRTGRKGKEGEGILILAPWEEFFLSSVKALPITKASPPSVDPDTKKKVELYEQFLAESIFSTYS